MRRCTRSIFLFRVQPLQLRRSEPGKVTDGQCLRRARVLRQRGHQDGLDLVRGVNAGAGLFWALPGAAPGARGEDCLLQVTPALGELVSARMYWMRPRTVRGDTSALSSHFLHLADLDTASGRRERPRAKRLKQ